MKGPMAIRRLLWVAVPGFVAFAGMESGMLRAQAQRPGQIVGGPGQVMSITAKPDVHIVVNFTELALQEELNP
ncbi:MAG: hypothetical protein HYX76_01580, partial [Acidobacteria bacterium]|nr:hypothetical protein [Acidobacteriota bacterium]